LFKFQLFWHVKLCRLVWQIAADVSKEYIAFNFSVTQSKKRICLTLNMKTLYFEMSATFATLHGIGL